MHNFFTGNGFLTQEGEQFVSDFSYGIFQIMESDEVADMSDAELRTLMSNMLKMVGDAISKRISRNIQFSVELEKMTDEEFYIHLQEKYGNDWILHSLEKEERLRLPMGDLQRLADEHTSINKVIRQHMIDNGVKFN